MALKRQSSGVVDLDRVLGGLIAGDNMVWVSEETEIFVRLEQAFLREGQRQGASGTGQTPGQSAGQTSDATVAPSGTVSGSC